MHTNIHTKGLSDRIYTTNNYDDNVLFALSSDLAKPTLSYHYIASATFAYLLKNVLHSRFNNLVFALPTVRIAKFASFALAVYLLRTSFLLRLSAFKHIF
jgi:hypothetical protein